MPSPKYTTINEALASLTADLNAEGHEMTPVMQQMFFAGASTVVYLMGTAENVKKASERLMNDLAAFVAEEP